MGKTLTKSVKYYKSLDQLHLYEPTKKYLTERKKWTVEQCIAYARREWLAYDLGIKGPWKGHQWSYELMQVAQSFGFARFDLVPLTYRAVKLYEAVFELTAADGGELILDTDRYETCPPVTSDQFQQILTVVSELPARNQEVLRWRYGLDEDRMHTAEDTAAHLHLSPDEVKDIEARSLVMLRFQQYQQQLPTIWGVNPADYPNKSEYSGLYHIEVLGFSDRVYQALMRAGLTTVMGIMDHPNLLEVEGIDRAAADEIVEKVHLYGLMCESFKIP